MVSATSYHAGSLARSHGTPHICACSHSVGRVPPKSQRSASIGAVTWTLTKPRSSEMPRL